MMEWVEAIDCDVVEATDRQLFIDIDSDIQYQIYTRMLPLLKKHFYFKKVTERPSKQGLPHRHITIDMDDSYSLTERIALQACLGSDQTRELLSVRRSIDREENVVIFFEKK